MLHTKFRGNRSTGSGEEVFFRFLPYMGVVAILVMPRTNFVPHTHIKFGFDRQSSF